MPIRWLVLSSCVDSAHFVPICLLSQQPCIINMIIRKCMRSVCEADYAYLAKRLGTANFEQVLVKRALYGLCCMQKSEASSVTSAGI